MNNQIEMKIAGLKVDVKSLERASGIVTVLSIIGVIALAIFGFVSDFNVLIIGAAAFLAVQALLVSALVSAFGSKLLLDAELASTKI